MHGLHGGGGLLLGYVLKTLSVGLDSSSPVYFPNSFWGVWTFSAGWDGERPAWVGAVAPFLDLMGGRCGLALLLMALFFFFFCV